MPERRPAPFPAEWGLSDPQLLARTVTGRVTRVRLPGGEPAVVKQLTRIGMKEELNGVHFLDFCDGNGCIRLLARKNGDLLLEYAGDRSLLDHLNEHGDDEASAIFCDVFLQLHQTASDRCPSDELPPLRQQFDSLFKRADRDRKQGLATPFTDAAALADRLLAETRVPRPLHGDLHHENILHGPRGWLAIDPKGLIGDSAYDVANMFYNPLERDDLRSSAVRNGRIAQMFAERLGRDAKDLLRFGIAHACLSASWHAEDGNGQEEARSLGVARSLRDALASHL
ncbi:phosphotransferase [Phyllobacterium sp. 0TCS1.6C]|uniref:aminoglycoside phosphotransferase family protein n=1 Tax=unclassified Phyllobacterium TaxID=2638441 RepID=UPI002265360D|nr:MULTISPECIES: aminoglycoside phosphotransferase family protein [unclassified Phyllobacterium]MCX8280383.1 phosphotransferase [Phyllobacterium sp. 0TCS1.6C]MCX8295168.1 phosphotransferase [Phyllobacterium sp. 0TCS1.6A]